MVVIRLTRVGKKNSPAYRVVIADKRRAVKRKFIEIIGHYNPMMKPKELVINKERALFWMENGAQPSDTVRNFMVDLGILEKDQKATKVYGKAMSKKAAKEAATGKPKETAPVEDVAEEEESAVAEEEVKAEESDAEAPVVEDAAEEVEEPATEEVAEEPAVEEKASTKE